ncbi:hypothetical protein BJ165DRAFT_1490766 [Panaeolus papilionaceus]|nr:hypothetical protein BJ165DRAFT_1490766 [Panaeolus papilionaceus]
MSVVGEGQSTVYPHGLCVDKPQNWISALPNELLMETFKLAVYEPLDSQIPPPEFPIQYTLTAVCRQWRYFVLDAKSLWTTIFLGPHASDLFFNFFERSKNAHLDIVVILDFCSDAMSDALVDRIASTLVSHAACTRSLRFRLTHHYDLIEVFFQDWVQALKSPLTYLEVFFDRKADFAAFRDLTDIEPPPLAFSSLKFLVLRNTLLHTVPQLTGLTTLDFRSERRTPVGVGKIVKHFPSLTRLIIRQLKVTLPEDNSNPPDNSPINAVHIKELIIHLGDETAGEDICRLYLPNLRYLESLGKEATADIIKHICTSKPPHLKKIRLTMMPIAPDVAVIISALQELKSPIALEIAESYLTYLLREDQIALFNLPTISSLTLIGIKTPIIVESLRNMFKRIGLKTLPFPVNIQVQREEWLGDTRLRKRFQKIFGDYLTLQYPVENEGVLGHQYSSEVFASKMRRDDDDSDEEPSSDEFESSDADGEGDVDTEDDESTSSDGSSVIDEDTIIAELGRQQIAAKEAESDEETEYEEQSENPPLDMGGGEPS